MSLTIVRIAIARLINSPMEIVVTIVVPIVFFSLFAVIFDRGLSVGSARKVKAVLIDDQNSPASRSVIERLTETGVIELVELAGSESTLVASSGRSPLEAGISAIREGRAKLVVHFPTGALQPAETPPAIRLLVDASDEIAPNVVSAILEQSASSVYAREQLMKSPVPGGVPFNVDPRVLPEASSASYPIEIEDALGEQKDNPRISMYAAGIAVMFLLFSSAGAAGTLLEEAENGTLERLLTSRISLIELLFGKWLYIFLLGVTQIVIMFAWAQVVFGVNTLERLPGFLLVTMATSAAAASLALFLATLCPTRSVLSGFSTLIILSMSAVGGSMIPRYIMSPQMQQYGLVTFNAWALDGYNKVYWRDLPPSALLPQLEFLAAASLVLAAGALLLARRWQTS